MSHRRRGNLGVGCWDYIEPLPGFVWVGMAIPGWRRGAAYPALPYEMPPAFGETGVVLRVALFAV